jgi:hypothetical protein
METFRWCTQCGRGFEPAGTTSKTCSVECRYERILERQGTPEFRHAQLVRRLEREKVPSTDLLYRFGFYASLIEANSCTYCEGPLSPTGHALDRIVNSKGHRCFNVVPCCARCNSIKGDDDNLTFEEMLILRPALIEIRIRRGSTRRNK